MTVTRERILSKLPPYEDKWQVVRKKQYVPDIINEIMTSHRLFAPYYDKFSSLFFTNDPAQLSERLYSFCKQNIEYREESMDKQTTAVPTGVLTRGYGDCKHYALFNAGVISSINRLYGTGFDWCYYFAGYRGAEEPHHVFVSLRDGNEEVWIDPTPGAGAEEPTLLVKRVST